jgi:tyrosyl-tRNA synthetase
MDNLDRLQQEVEQDVRAIERGCMEIISREELAQKLLRSKQTAQPLKIKVGFDPSAPDIHLGHTVQLRKMRRLQDMGHTVYYLIGDFTAMVGDPSGRKETRPTLTKEQVLENAETYQRQACKILDEEKLKLVFNSEWFEPMTFAEVMELTSKYTVARLLERDDFAKRLDDRKPITVLELLYALMQAYDSVSLAVDIEMGGTDQKFNLLVGRDLQRAYGQEPQVAIIMPLLVGTDGVQKMSKSLGNYIGIDEPPNEMYGKTMSISDEIMFDYLTLLTDIPTEETDSMRTDIGTGRLNPKEVKKRLARELVCMYHGEDQSLQAEREFKKVFVGKGLPDDIEEVALTQDRLKDNGKIWIVELLVLAGFAETRNEARRLVEGGGVSLDGKKVKDASLDVQPGDGMILRAGKRRFAKVALAE